MPYDSNMYKSLFSKAYESETGRLTVSIYSYNNGAKKLQISRENRNQDGEWKFAKLGRMFKDEVEAIIPLMQKAIEFM